MTGIEKLCKLYLKKLFFQIVLVFIDCFYRCHYLLYFIYSDCVRCQVCTTCNSIIFTQSSEKNYFFSIKSFLWRPWFLLEKNQEHCFLCFTFKSNLIQKTLSVILRKKCIIFELNKCICRNCYLCGCWL